MNKFVKAPDFVTFNECIENDFKLSSSLYTKLIMKNTNVKLVSDFLLKNLSNSDLGTEIGSLSYIDKSTHYFLRTKGLQKHSFIPVITKESALPMLPTDFVNMNLMKGDLIISKDSNIGEIAILEKDYPNYMLSSAIYKLPVKEEWKYYLFAMIKHAIFREQLDAIVPKGATIRHAKTLFLKCLIPLPNKNLNEVIRYISAITKQIIEKESLIQKRHEDILRLIETELLQNQNDVKFRYNLPCINEVEQIGRLDTSLYSQYFKNQIFKITNYKYGSKNIFELDFTLSRGQNLQVSNIGDSIYSLEKHKNFYTLILPKFLSRYGTIEKEEYLGNKNNLRTIDKGDIIFGAEGFEKGRSIVVLEKQDKIITNIHGITIQHRYKNISLSVFIKLFLDYLRSKELVDLYAVGGNGGSLAQKYWDIIPFPLFPESKQNEIVKLYTNDNVVFNLTEVSLEDFEKVDSKFNQEAGIYELDKSMKYLKEKLNQTINTIVEDLEVEIKF